MAVREYLRREHGSIVAANVDSGLVMPLEHLTIPVEIDGEPYYRHPVGGGLVAASSFVPDDLRLPHYLTVRPDTRIVSDVGMEGQLSLRGDFWNPDEVSRDMDEEGAALLQKQRETGMIPRLIRIERLLAAEALRRSEASLF